MATPEKINLQRLAYVHYRHSDFEKFVTFAEAFGLTKAGEDENSIYYQGYGKDPICYIASRCGPGHVSKFKGPGFMARTKEDFERAGRIPGAVRHDISNRPGGGAMVAVPDPNGFEVEILWGIQETPITASDASSSQNGATEYNGAVNKHRIGKFKRLRKGPAMVHKLGHFGYLTANFEATCDWYKTTFNIAEIDVMSSPVNAELVVGKFFRLDLGEEFVDHHTMLVTRGEGTESYPHHSSFEVEDFDTQLLGHDWLEEKGYELVWGVGRHIFGSQVFDYWRDSSNFIVEHYADGDLVNCHNDVEYGVMGKDGAIWGAAAPDFRPRPETVATVTA